ncbi:coagulation factor XIII B chain-like [Ptychodera flava]|uniref:coagulation factor XIII B chain-like n=1 Tax=Ptychodera flava TaxID=63121 RepID=UPI00396A71A1
MRPKISLLLLTIFLYLNFDGTEGQCTAPTLTGHLQWAGDPPPPTLAESATVAVECPTGLVLTGSGIITCRNGYLTTVPRCEPADCTDPGDTENGEKTGFFFHGETVTYTCNDGYTLRGSAELTCSLGSWDNSVPTCVAETSTTKAATTEADSATTKAATTGADSATTKAATTGADSGGTATIKATATGADLGESGAGVPVFGYFMIPAVILALFSS